MNPGCEASGAPHELLVLGNGEVATVDLRDETLFFPAEAVYRNDPLQGGIAQGGRVGL